MWNFIRSRFGSNNDSASVGVSKDESKRILIYNWRDTRHVWAGGAEVHVQQLAEEWVRMGHEVTLFCSNDRHSSQKSTVGGVKIYRRGGFVSVYWWGFWYYLTRFRGNVDVIVDCENGIPFFTPIYSSVPVILSVNHVHRDVFFENLIRPLALLATFLETVITPFVYRNSEMMTISESTRREIGKHFRGKSYSAIKVVNCGIDLNTYKPGVKSHKPLVVYVGRLKPYKRLEDFIQVAAAMKHVKPTVSFVIAGEGEDYQRLEKMIADLTLEGVVKMRGKVSEAEKIKLYQRAWVAMNPSSMEGWSITTIEANACGTPVIGANVPGLRDSIQHRQTGMLVSLGDEKAYALELFRLITNKSLRLSMSRQARSWAEEFSWEKSARSAMSLIQGVLDQQKAGGEIEGKVKTSNYFTYK